MRHRPDRQLHRPPLTALAAAAQRPALTVVHIAEWKKARGLANGASSPNRTDRRRAAS
jgi:hypothetical protein